MSKDLMNTNAITLEPIGYFRSSTRYREEAPRQPGFAAAPGVIELLPGKNFETALADLIGFDRVWVLFAFHLNAGNGWKPKVSPPLTPDGARYGVFATRSPHRPNPIGMSCLEVSEIEGLNLRVKAADLLDGTPILDIKPYIPEIDAFPDSKAGWRDRLNESEWAVSFTPEAEVRADWIAAHTGLDLRNWCGVQLRFDPLNRKRKRLEDAPGSNGGLILHSRTWKIAFTPDSHTRTIRVTDITGNYSPADLAPDAPDPYGDKDAHRAFRITFPSGEISV